MLAHPVVHLLGVSVEELQVHALLVLLPAHLPQLQQGLLFLAQDLQLQQQTDTSRVTTLAMMTSSAAETEKISPTFSLTSSEA